MFNHDGGEYEYVELFRGVTWSIATGSLLVECTEQQLIHNILTGQDQSFFIE